VGQGRNTQVSLCGWCPSGLVDLAATFETGDQPPPQKALPGCLNADLPSKGKNSLMANHVCVSVCVCECVSVRVCECVSV